MKIDISINGEGEKKEIIIALLQLSQELMKKDDWLLERVPSLNARPLEMKIKKAVPLIEHFEDEPQTREWKHEPDLSGPASEEIKQKLNTLLDNPLLNHFCKSEINWFLKGGLSLKDNERMQTQKVGENLLLALNKEIDKKLQDNKPS